jgi:hypothetical protein
MATHAITKQASRAHLPRIILVASALAVTLGIGLGIGRATSPTPESRWQPTTTLTVPWRTDWINAVNRLERQQSRDGAPGRRG